MTGRGWWVLAHAVAMLLVGVLREVSLLTVPALADWSMVVHRGESEVPRCAALAAGDPEVSALLEKLEGCSPDLDAEEGPSRVFRTGELVVYADITPEQLSPTAAASPVVGTRDPEALGVFRAVGLRSLACLPLRGRSGVEAVVIL